MADIFISYSRKDLDQALSLVERLKAEGFDVWIDRHGIEGANSWSKEIANALESASIFLLLLSESSVASPNVSKELGVATLLQKRIVPLRLDRVELRGEFLYHLANLQYVRFEDFDALASVLSGKPTVRGMTPARNTDDRKSLMILPFDDLSPTADNGWFADGIVSELITALSNVKSLVVTDPQTTKDFKRYKGTLPAYAKEMSIRYFVHGDVRKFGDSIKIAVRLLDIATGDYLWQDSMKGTMADIFDVQETVANNVVEGLRLHLSLDEKNKLTEHGTESTEAYELYWKAYQYFERQTKEGFQIAAQLFTEAIRKDAGYANAYRFKALVLASLYRMYDRDPALLTEAEQLCKEARRTRPGLAKVYHSLATIYMLQGKHAEAQTATREYIRIAPEDYNSHFALGFFFMEIGDHAKAIEPLEESVRLKPDDRVTLFNLCLSCHDAGEPEKLRSWAIVALPIEERHLTLQPDDEVSRMRYADLLFWGGLTEEAGVEAMKLKQARDGFTLFNTACLFAMMGNKHEALETSRKSIEAGFRNLRQLKSFIADEEDFGSLHGTPEYEEVKRMVDEIEREAEAKNNV